MTGQLDDARVPLLVLANDAQAPLLEQLVYAAPNIAHAANAAGEEQRRFDSSDAVHP